MSGKTPGAWHADCLVRVQLFAYAGGGNGAIDRSKAKWRWT